MTEDERTVAIEAFKKGFFKIIDESEGLDRNSMAKRIPADGYIGAVIRRLITQG